MRKNVLTSLLSKNTWNTDYDEKIMRIPGFLTSLLRENEGISPQDLLDETMRFGLRFRHESPPNPEKPSKRREIT